MYRLVQKFAENFPPFLRENLWWAALIKVKKKPAQIEVRQFPKQTIEVSLIIVLFIFSTNPIVFYKTPVTNKQTRIVIIYKILSLFFVAKINYNWCRKITKTDLKNLSWLVKLFVKTSDFFVVSSFNERKKKYKPAKIEVRQFPKQTMKVSLITLFLNLLYEASVMRPPPATEREKKICTAAASHTFMFDSFDKSGIT